MEIFLITLLRNINLLSLMGKDERVEAVFWHHKFEGASPSSSLEKIDGTLGIPDPDVRIAEDECLVLLGFACNHKKGKEFFLLPLLFFVRRF